MADYAYFDHNDPAPPVARDPFTRMLDCGYAAGGALGENIAAGQASPADVMAAWIASSGHRANIENPAFQSIGVGVAQGAIGPYWVQDFAGAAGVRRGPAARPRPLRLRPRRLRRLRPRRRRRRRLRLPRRPSRRRLRALRARRRQRSSRPPIRAPALPP